MVREQHHFPQFKQYSRVLPGEERIHENILVKEPSIGLPCSTVSTVWELIQRTTCLHPKSDFLGDLYEGKYRFKTYEQVLELVKYAGSASIQLGGENNGLAGLAGVHSVNYELAMFGLVSQSISLVPLYHNSKIEAICEMIENCNLQLIFCDTSERRTQLLEMYAQGRISSVTTLVTLNGRNTEENNNCPDGVKVFDFEEFLEIGRNNPLPPRPPSADDVYIICHTSGTTGRPKGVQLTHQNLLTATGGLFRQWCITPHHFAFGTNDTFFSFLSLAHIYEHLMQTFTIYIGGRVGIYGGNVANLIKDIQTLRPTIISLVPRILNKLYDQVHSNVAKNHLLARKLFNTAKNAKVTQLLRGINNPNTVWDKLVFEKVRAVLGGQVRVLTTGGAPVTEDVRNFITIAFGCPLFEGYGQTECGAAGTLNLPGDLSAGHVGAPAPWSQIKLVSVPEMGYNSSEDKGEVCFRGAAVMRGYYKDEELTKQTIDEEGWLHTGDIGEWLPDGRLRVIDRKNALFKLAQGDFVSPEAVESLLLVNPLVNQLFVTGLSTRSFLVAVAVVNPNVVKQAVEGGCDEEAKHHLSLDENSFILQDSVKRFVLNQLAATGRERGLQTIELPKNIHLTTMEWSAESGTLTPTLKLRRQILREQFNEEIAQMYGQHEGL